MTYASFTINPGTNSITYTTSTVGAPTHTITTGTAEAGVGTFKSIAIDYTNNAIYGTLTDGTKYVFDVGAPVTITLNSA